MASTVGPRAAPSLTGRPSRRAASAAPRSRSTLSGARLGDAQEIIYYQPGSRRSRLKKVNDNAVKATLKIAADCRARACTISGSARPPASASCGRSASGRSRR